jgi:glutathione S-transferase
MTDLLLHHYDRSPYAEKARSMLGHKGLSWCSVKQPRIMPKPDLVALTGGYRRIPVLQIGADIVCDTRLIAIELERVRPEPPLFPAGGAPLARVLSEWADAYLFWLVAPFVMGCWADDLPDAFLEDRAAMSGVREMSRERMKAALPHQRSQIRAVLPWLAEVLSQTAFVGGKDPSYHDFAVYHCLWFLAATQPGQDLLADARLSPLVDWMARMRATGHGERRELDPEQAIEIARATEPRAVPKGTQPPEGPRLGDAVSVKPERFGTERVTGTRQHIGDERLIVALESPRAGTVHVHLPRLGQVVTPA